MAEPHSLVMNVTEVSVVIVGACRRRRFRAVRVLRTAGLPKHDVTVLTAKYAGATRPYSYQEGVQYILSTMNIHYHQLIIGYGMQRNGVVRDAV